MNCSEDLWKFEHEEEQCYKLLSAKFLGSSINILQIAFKLALGLSIWNSQWE
jgi:hypothetical protein